MAELTSKVCSMLAPSPILRLRFAGAIAIDALIEVGQYWALLWLVYLSSGCGGDGAVWLHNSVLTVLCIHARSFLHMSLHAWDQLRCNPRVLAPVQQ